MSAAGAHPRSRGATPAAMPTTAEAGGPSPLARGNLAQGHAGELPSGPIPARAGQPARCRHPERGWWAHPRSRGATSAARAVRATTKGPSPLARGNRGRGARHSSPVGPIPARAGQPRPGGAGAGAHGAHPRSRGATMCKVIAESFAEGPSPLARGNPVAGYTVQPMTGPIPARAGQPSGSRSAASACGAHPRSRGATNRPHHSRKKPTGPSPLARGNHVAGGCRACGQGPIPARAGQPPGALRQCRRPRAHPRSRGATGLASPTAPIGRGPSPLARGNPPRGHQGRAADGPIPARAGQPQQQLPLRLRCRAHPRSRGATRATSPGRTSAPGPSPLARGNHHETRRTQAHRGPIPARAGQPPGCTPAMCRTTAHPRSRGATRQLRSHGRGRRGPSPLARGNRHGSDEGADGAGPIPARAGQPGVKLSPVLASRAHPRSRGAT